MELFSFNSLLVTRNSLLSLMLLMLRTNALIIGGGPAGATAARFLAESGVETVLVERDPSYVKPCGGGVPSSALEELHIPPGVVKQHIKKIRIVSPTGEEVGIELAGGHLCITERGVFDTMLRSMARERGAALEEGEFVRFEQAARGMVSVIRRREDGGEVKIRSDYLIAADGITSRVAAALGCPRPPCLYTISAKLKPVPLQGGAGMNGACEFWFGEEHASRFYSWIFPSREHASIGTGSRNPKELSSLLDRFTRRRFNTPFHNLAASLSGKTRAFRIPEWNGKLFNIGNVLFAGDAAGMVMPVTYEGIYYAMKSGEFAARAIIEGNPSAYKKLWKHRFHRRFLLMSKIRERLFRSDREIEKWVALHKNPEVQELAMRLWLQKKSGNATLAPYLGIFRSIFRGMSV